MNKNYVIESKGFNYAKKNIVKMKNEILELQLIENGFLKKEKESGIVFYDKGKFRVEKVGDKFICEELLSFKNIEEILNVEKIKNEYNR